MAQEKISITLSREDAEIIEQLKVILNKQLLMNLSRAQIVRRCLKQALAEAN